MLLPRLLRLLVRSDRCSIRAVIIRFSFSCVFRNDQNGKTRKEKKPSCTSQVVVVVVVVCSGANRYLHVLTFTVGGARWVDGTNVKECADPAATCLSARCHSSRALANLMLHLFLFMCVMYAFCDWPSFLNQ